MSGIISAPTFLETFTACDPNIQGKSVSLDIWAPLCDEVYPDGLTFSLTQSELLCCKLSTSLFMKSVGEWASVEHNSQILIVPH